MTAVEAAVRRGDWERLALYLLLGVSKAAEKLPPESLEALVDLLAGHGPVERRDGR